MAYVTVDVDLDGLDTDDLVNELSDRLESKWRSNYEKQQILNLGDNKNLFFEVKTLEDQLKVEHIAKVFKKYSISQIESLLPE